MTEHYGRFRADRKEVVVCNPTFMTIYSAFLASLRSFLPAEIVDHMLGGWIGKSLPSTVKIPSFLKVSGVGSTRSGSQDG